MSDQVAKFAKKLRRHLPPGEQVLAAMPYDGSAVAVAGFGVFGVLGLAGAEKLRARSGNFASVFPANGGVVVLTDRRLLALTNDAFGVTVRGQFAHSQIRAIGTQRQTLKGALLITFEDGSTFAKGEGKKGLATTFAAAWENRPRRPQDQPGWVDPAFLNL